MNIDYNELIKIRELSFFSSIGCLAFSELITSDENMLTILQILLAVIYVNTLLDKTEGKAKDIQEIRKIYDEIINDYNKLSDTLSLNNPIEIYAMFTYLLNEGYLSNNKKFAFVDNNVKDVYSIEGANIINGQGVCRHIAKMLDDIYNKKGIESKTLSVKVNPSDIKLKQNIEQIEIEELYKKVENITKSKDRRKLLIELIRMCNGEIMIEKNNEKIRLIEKILISHLIVTAKEGEKTYYLDPTQARIYKYSAEEKRLYDELGIIMPVRNKGLCIDNISIYEERKKIIGIEMHCNNNIDLIEKFYKEHKESYREISDKMGKIKNRKIPFL